MKTYLKNKPPPSYRKYLVWLTEDLHAQSHPVVPPNTHFLQCLLNIDFTFRVSPIATL